MEQRTCIVDGCEKPRKWKSRMCSAHRHRLTRYGDPLGGPPPRPPAPVRTCEVDGCDRKHYAKGWCTRHYDRALRHDDPLREVPRIPAECTIDGCRAPMKARGWCASHYARWRRNGDPLASAPPRREDVMGRRFGRLTVVAYNSKRYGWECVCDCGAPVFTSVTRLKSGQSISCGRPGPCGWSTEVPTYRAMHARVQRLHGKATSRRCVDCDGRAEQWSYDHGDSGELTEMVRGAEVRYSANPDRYAPRCISCHISFDRHDRRT